MWWPYYFMLGTVADGACTELWTGLEKGITVGDGRRYVIPFGRWHKALREDLLKQRHFGTGVKRS